MPGYDSKMVWMRQCFHFDAFSTVHTITVDLYVFSFVSTFESVFKSMRFQ